MNERAALSLEYAEALLNGRPPDIRIRQRLFVLEVKLGRDGVVQQD